MIAFKKAMALWGSVAALVLCGINSSVADSAADLAALHAADEAFVSAYNGRDAAAVASLYDEHAVLLPPGSAPVDGRAAIRAFFVRDIAESEKAGVAFKLGANPAGGVSGSMGWASGTFTVVDKSGHIVDSGKYLSVSRKKDGKWLYVRDTWNSDGQPPAAPAAKK